MMEEDKITDRIENYLNRNMTDDELSEFNKDLKNDTQLGNTLKEYQILMKAVDLQEEENLLQKFNDWEGNKSKKVKTTIYFSGIAACLTLIVIGLYMFFLNNSPITLEKIIAENYTSPQPISGNMGNSFAQWSQGMEAYRNKNYERALKEWLLIEEPTPQMQFFTAHAYIHSKQVNSATIIFTKLSNGTSVYSYSSDWYLLMTYLMDNNFEKFIQKSDIILKDKAHPYYEDVMMLVEQVNLVNQ